MAQDNFNYGTPLKGVNRRQGILDELKRNGYDVSFADPTPGYAARQQEMNISTPAVQEIGVAGLNDSMYDKDITSATQLDDLNNCLLYTSPSPRDRQKSRMPSSA